MKRFIAIAGNMGVGKSTLTKLLTLKLGWEPFYEAVDDNPYLADFYDDMEKWAFHSQLFFLCRHLLDHRHIVDHPISVIQDRSIYEDAEIFARNLHDQGHMTERDYGCYRELYETLIGFLPPPDVIIYLRASVPTLMQRVAHRGRDFERQVSIGYLEQLNALYEEWASTFSLCPVLSIPADEMDFVKHEAHLEQIATWLIYKALPELFRSRPASKGKRRGRRVPHRQASLPGVERRVKDEH